MSLAFSFLFEHTHIFQVNGCGCLYRKNCIYFL